MAGLVLVDIGPELDARGVLRIRMEMASSLEPVFGSVDEYARLLSLHYPAATPDAIIRMACHGLRPARGRALGAEDGSHAARRPRAVQTPEQAAERERRAIAGQWEALARIPCPTLVVRGAASDVFAPDTADRMVHEVLQKGALAVVPQAGHSVMTDNPKGFESALSGFLLSGE